MSVVVGVFIPIFAVIGVIAAVNEIAGIFRSHRKKIYVYFSKECADKGAWDIVVSSDEEDNILSALVSVYPVIYIEREADRWKTEVKESKERSKK